MVELTYKQRQLIRDLDEITKLLALNYHDTGDENVDTKQRTALLELNKNQIIRSEVVLKYTLLDDFFDSIILHYYFGKTHSFIKLWRTKKFKRFNHFLLENLSLLNKLDFVGEIIKLPSEISKFVYDINGLRNGLAHSFFPENRRKNKPIYKGRNIFTVDGIKLFEKDSEKVVDFFMKVAYGITL